MKYAIKTGNITQVTLLTNVTRYLNNIVAITSLILHNIITTSNEVANVISNPLCIMPSYNEVMKPAE